MAELHVLLKERRDALHGGFKLCIGLNRIAGQAYRGLHETFGIDDLQNFSALDAFDQNFDVAVGELQALHDVDDRSYLVNFVSFWLVHTGIVLGSQEDFLVRGQGFF